MKYDMDYRALGSGKEPPWIFTCACIFMNLPKQVPAFQLVEDTFFISSEFRRKIGAKCVKLQGMVEKISHEVLSIDAGSGYARNGTEQKTDLLKTWRCHLK